MKFETSDRSKLERMVNFAGEILEHVAKYQHK